MLNIGDISRFQLVGPKDKLECKSPQRRSLTLEVNPVEPTTVYAVYAPEKGGKKIKRHIATVSQYEKIRIIVDGDCEITSDVECAMYTRELMRPDQESTESGSFTSVMPKRTVNPVEQAMRMLALQNQQTLERDRDHLFKRFDERMKELNEQSDVPLDGSAEVGEPDPESKPPEPSAPEASKTDPASEKLTSEPPVGDGGTGTV